MAFQSILILFVIYSVIDTLAFNTNSGFCYETGSISSCYSVDVNNDDGFIICHGYRSCYKSKLVAGTMIDCGGYHSCNANIGIESRDGSISCNGEQSCANGDVMIAAEEISCNGDFGCYKVRSATAGSYIQCNGNYGCYLAPSLEADDYIQCNGRYSCYGVGIISGDYVYITGNRGAYEANINSVNDVQCAGPYSCYKATIEAGADVQIESNYAAYKAVITAVNNLYCDASYSCAYTEITAGHILSHGYYGAYYADITTEYVSVYGYRGISFSDVRQKEDKPLSVELYGFEAAFNTDIYCLSTTLKCDIHCHSKSSCHLATVYYTDMEMINIEPSDCKSDEYDGDIICPSFIAYNKAIETARNEHKKTSEEFKQIERELDTIFGRELEERTSDDEGMMAALSFNLYEDKGRKNLDGVQTNISKVSMDSIYGVMFGGVFVWILMCLYSICSKNKGKVKKIADSDYEPLL